MHHDDIRAGINFFLSPLLDPSGGTKPSGSSSEKIVPKGFVVDMIVLIDDHEVGLLAGISNALENALGIFFVAIKTIHCYRLHGIAVVPCGARHVPIRSPCRRAFHRRRVALQSLTSRCNFARMRSYQRYRALRSV